MPPAAASSEEVSRLGCYGFNQSRPLSAPPSTMVTPEDILKFRLEMAQHLVQVATAAAANERIENM